MIPTDQYCRSYCSNQDNPVPLFFGEDEHGSSDEQRRGHYVACIADDPRVEKGDSGKQDETEEVGPIDLHFPLFHLTCHLLADPLG